MDVYMTAFGSFEGVEKNPTIALLASLERDLTQANAQWSCRLGSATVLPVVAEDVSSWLMEKLYPQIYSDSSSRPALVLHLGVDVTDTRVKLETCAANEASFRCPDCSGWQPDRECIEQDLPISLVRTTTLPVARMVRQLRRSGVCVSQSVDAGRYVCNWTYYKSLKTVRERAAKRPVHVLFVHVPPFHALSEEEQRRTLSAIVQECAAVSLR